MFIRVGCLVKGENKVVAGSWEGKMSRRKQARDLGKRDSFPSSHDGITGGGTKAGKGELAKD